MVLPVAGLAAGAAGGSGGGLQAAGGAAGPSEATSSADFTANVQVAPVGLNIGELLRNFEGPPANGGFGLERQSRLFGGGGVASANVGGIGLSDVLLIGSVALAALLFIRR